MFQLLEIVLVSSVPNVHLRLERLATNPTVLPLPRMALHVMKTAESQPPVISRAAIMSIREENVLVLIITDPIATTVGLDEIAGLPA